MTTARPVDGHELNPWVRSDEPVRVAVAITIAVAAFALLTLPVDTRDLVLLAGAGLWTVVALADIAAAWTFFILVLPFVHVVGSMFGVAQLTFVRLMLVCAACVFPFTTTGRTIPKAIAREAGFVAFALFVAASLASAVRLANASAIFRALSYSEPAVFCALTYCIVRRNPVRFKTIAAAVAIGGVVVAALGVVELMTQQSIVGTLGIELPGVLVDPQVYLEQDRFGLGGRVMSTMVQPVYAALYFAIWMFVAAYCVSTAPKLWRGLLFLIAPIGLLMVVATGSRGPLLAILPAAAVVALRGRSNASVSLRLLTAGVILIVGLPLLVPQLLPFLQASLSLDVANPENANVLGRIELTNRLLDYFRLSPVWGHGPGVIQHEALEGSLEFAGLVGQENQYAVILADGGLVCGAAYVFFMVAALWSVMNAAGSQRKDLRAAGRLALGLFVFYFVAITTVTSLTQIPNYLLMIVYGGVVALRDAGEPAVSLLRRGGRDT